MELLTLGMGTGGHGLTSPLWFLGAFLVRDGGSAINRSSKLLGHAILLEDKIQFRFKDKGWVIK